MNLSLASGLLPFDPTVNEYLTFHTGESKTLLDVITAVAVPCVLLDTESVCLNYTSLTWLLGSGRPLS